MMTIITAAAYLAAAGAAVFPPSAAVDAVSAVAAESSDFIDLPTSEC